MKNLVLIIFCCLPFLVISQSMVNLATELSKEEKIKMLTLYADLHEKGVELTGDSIKTSREFKKVLADESYRAVLFPEVYTWEQTVVFFNKQELKQAFWYFINLYPENEKNKEVVLKSVLAYDEILEMDEILVNTFYSYIFMDPEISVIKNGVPEIVRPDILEAKLKSVKEIVESIFSYRKHQEEIAGKQ